MKHFNMGQRAPGDSARRFATPKPKGSRFKTLATNPAIVEGRSLFQPRVVHPAVLLRCLKSGANASKIGKDIRKGRWRGFPVFTLTLEERRTCPRSCAVWGECYGNNMHMADRIIHGEALENRLAAELAALQAEHPGGFAVRLHILGDFYSEHYARLWVGWLDRFPALHVFGFTARSPLDPIGRVIFDATTERWARFAIRFSGSGMSLIASLVVRQAEDVPDGATLCPAQTGATDRCGTCALCWQSQRPIAFLEH